MYDGRAAYHVRRFPRPSPSVFAYWKRSKAGGVEGLGTRLHKRGVSKGGRPAPPLVCWGRRGQYPLKLFDFAPPRASDGSSRKHAD